MRVGTKIALFYTSITVGVLSIVTFIFYLVAIGYINRLYFSHLTDKAFVTAEKHWEEDELDAESYARIQQRYEETLPVATEILLNADSLESTYQTLSRYLTSKEIKDLYNGKTILFTHRNQMGSALYYPDNEGNFIVMVISGNQYGVEISHRIGWLLLGTMLISAFLIYLVGKWYATRMIDRIDSAYKSEKSFISSASHELNNPLTAIQGECEISLLKERSPQEYQAALRRITSETKRIILLMKHLLFLSHGDKEILKQATEPIMLADFMMQFTNKRVCFSPDTFGFAVEANPHLLKIAIGNLIENACKYSGEKEVDIQLRGNILTIRDEGIGIPEEDQERIFQPFFRAGNTRDYSGHGIGLSLSARILQLYGAGLHITSQAGSGTTVKIEFA